MLHKHAGISSLILNNIASFAEVLSLTLTTFYFFYRCEQMPQAYEDRCCQREPLDRTHIPDYQKGKCLQNCQVIKHVLSEINAQMSWLQNRRYYGLTGDDLNFQNMTDKSKRHYAYRNYIDFMFGKLGRHNRRVIPACIVLYVRRTWPGDGNYVGFIYVDENGNPVDEADLVDL